MHQNGTFNIRTNGTQPIQNNGNNEKFLRSKFVAGKITTALFLFLILRVILPYVLQIATYNFFSVSLQEMPSDAIVNLASYTIEYAAIFIAMVVSILFLQYTIKIPTGIAFSYKAVSTGYVLSAISIMLGLFFAITLLLDIVKMIGSNLGIHLSNAVIPLANTPQFMVYTIFSIIALPIVYEYFFRGIILQSLRIFGDRAAIVISSIFATIFYYNTDSMLVYAIFSLCAAFFVIKSGSISLSITAHITIATLVTIFVQLKEIYPMHTYQFIKGTIFAVLIVAAILGILFLVKTRAKPFYIQKGDCPFSLVKKLSLTCFSTYSILVFILYFVTLYYFIG